MKIKMLIGIGGDEIAIADKIVYFWPEATIEIHDGGYEYGCQSTMNVFLPHGTNEELFFIGSKLGELAEHICYVKTEGV